MRVTGVSLCGLIGAITLLAASASAQTSSQIQLGGQIMPPGFPNGMITGKVVDENGAAVRVMVQTWAEATGPDGVRRQMSTGMRQTDEQGQFTVERLQPGDYFVAVFPSQTPPFPYSPAPGDATAYPITYFPGVTLLAQAQRVAAATSPQPITIRIRRVKAFHVHGTLTSSTGRSTQGMRVQTAQAIGMNRMTRGTAVVGRDGTFDIGGLPPGVYTLSASTGFGDSPTDFATKDIEIVDRDLEGVTLPLTSGGVITGRITLEPSTRTPAPLALMVMASPAPPKPGEARTAQFPRPVQVNADWTFQLRGLNGLYRFTLQMDALPDFALVRTVLDGRDIGSTLEVPVTAGTHQLVFHLARKP